MTYTSEMKSDTLKTKRTLETTERRIPTRITSNRFRGRIRSDEINWILNRKRQRNSHISRITDDMVKITVNKSPSEVFADQGICTYGDHMTGRTA